LVTLTLTDAEVVRLFAASRATAVSACDPLATVVVFHDSWYGEAVSSAGSSSGTGAGSVRVALRSLGSARTLVLVNGRRMVPGGTGADPAADLSTIPTAAIERVEILKDGASAIYGSDAIAGVVNVILRKRYTGTEIGGFAGISQHGDGTTYDIHGLSGTAGDKGSILFAVGYQDQHEILAGARNWSKTTYSYDFDTGDKTATGNSSKPVSL